MYKTFYEMKNKPFTRNIPAEHLYESPAMRNALERLIFAADEQLFAVVTADSGCGKSTLLRRFKERMPKDEYLILYLPDSKLTPRWFCKGLLDQLGIESRFYRGDAKRQLQKEVEIIKGVQKKKVVCVLDEIYKHSTGTMRIINRICDKSLMYACQQNKRLIDEHVIRYIVTNELLGGGSDDDERR